MANLRLRIGTTALVAAAAATLAPGAPAAADVTVTPAQAVQGDAGRLVFRITNDSAKASLVRVELQLPAANPVAEVYPLSVPKWAPRITTRPLDRSLPGLHGGSVRDITTAITWTPAAGGAVKPGKAMELPVALGPLPQTPVLAFSMVQTYSDGTVTRTTSRPGQPVSNQVTVRLLPAAAGSQAGGAPRAGAGGHGHGAAPAAAPPQARTAAGTPAPTTNWWSIAGWVCAGLIGGCALLVLRRGRRPEQADAQQAGPARAAGTDRSGAAGDRTPKGPTAKASTSKGTAGKSTAGRSTAATGTTAKAAKGTASKGNAPRNTGSNDTSNDKTSAGTDERQLAAAATSTPVRQAEMGSRWTYRERG